MHPLHRFLMPDSRPVIHSSVFIAQGATVIGDVRLEEDSSVWYGAVLRGDIHRIRVGAGSNIQDGTIVHVSDDYPAEIGERVTVGHRAVIHACKVGDETLVGMGAIVLDGAEIGPRCVIGAGALVTKGAVIPEGSLVVGSPMRIVRALSDEERRANLALARKYIEVSRRYIELGHGAPHPVA